MGRPKLEMAIATLGTGDVLVLPEWDRATKPLSTEQGTGE
jgi:hypothetical protein